MSVLFVYLMSYALYFRNPHVIEDSVVLKKDTSSLIPSIPDSGNVSFNLKGIKSFILTGEGTSNFDFTQAMNLSFAGKMGRYWHAEGHLEDSDMQGAYDLYTENIMDIDRVYMKFYRNTDTISVGNIEVLDRSVLGGKIHIKQNKFNIIAQAGVEKGESYENEFYIEPGNTGPYKLHGKNGVDVSIVPGSEKIIIEGAMLPKARYTMDYSRGILFLSPGVLYVKPVVCFVRFQYYYSTSKVFTANAQTYINLSALKFGFNIQREFTKPDGILKARGDYIRKDSIFVFAGRGRGDYTVNFIFVGDSGSYVYDDSTLSYTFVGYGKGLFNPQTEEKANFSRSNAEFFVENNNAIYISTKLYGSEDISPDQSSRGFAYSQTIGYKKSNFNTWLSYTKPEESYSRATQVYDSISDAFQFGIPNQKLFGLQYQNPDFAVNLHTGKEDSNFFGQSDIYALKPVNLRFTGRTLYQKFTYLRLDAFKYAAGFDANYQRREDTVFKSLKLFAKKASDTAGIMVIKDREDKKFLFACIHEKQSSVLALDATMFSSSLESFFGFFNLIMKPAEFSTVNVAYKRQNNLLSLYEDRYIFTPQGGFLYDSVSDRFVKSPSGNYRRVVVPVGSLQEGVQNMANIGIEIRNKSLQSDINLSMNEMANIQSEKGLETRLLFLNKARPCIELHINSYNYITPYEKMLYIQYYKGQFSIYPFSSIKLFTSYLNNKDDFQAFSRNNINVGFNFRSFFEFSTGFNNYEMLYQSVAFPSLSLGLNYCKKGVRIQTKIQYNFTNAWIPGGYSGYVIAGNVSMTRKIGGLSYRIDGRMYKSKFQSGSFALTTSLLM